MKKSVLLFAIIILVSVPSFAQFTVGANFTIANPQYGFEQVSDKNIYGLSIDGGYNFYWLTLGGNFGYLYRGGASSERGIPNLPGVNVNVDITHSLVQAHLLLRLQYPNPYLIPYIEGLAGGNFFSTTSEAKSKNTTGDQQPFASNTAQSDFTYSVGYGAGLMAKVYESQYEGKDFSIWVDLKGRFLKGGEAEYLQSADDIYYDENSKKWEAKKTKSTTSMNTWHIGVAFRF